MKNFYLIYLSEGNIKSLLLNLLTNAVGCCHPDCHLDRATATYPIVAQRSQWVRNLRKGLRKGYAAPLTLSGWFKHLVSFPDHGFVHCSKF